MRLRYSGIFFLLLALLPLHAQTQIQTRGGNRTKGWFSVLGVAANVTSGTSLPGSCTWVPADNQIFIRTSDNTIHLCNSSGNFVLVGGGAAGVGLVLANDVTDIDDSVMVQFSSGTTVPASCTKYGLIFYDTDGAAGQQVWHCNGSTYINANAITSVHGRTGAVVGAIGDYDATQVVNAADISAANNFAPGQVFTSTASLAAIKATCGTPPTSPANGDIWCDSTDSNKLKGRSNSTTVELGGGGAATGSVITSTTGGYYAPFGSTGSGTSVNPGIGTANRVYLYQFTIPYQMDLAKIRLNVPVAGTASCKINVGIFTSAKALEYEPSTKIDCSTTGVKEASLGSQTLTQGTHFIGIGTNEGTGVTVTYLTTSSSFTPLINSGSDARFGYCTNTLDVAAAFPSTCGSFTEPTITSVPWVALFP